MSWSWYDSVLNQYKSIKHFPDNSNLITNPKNSTLTLNGKILGNDLLMHVLFYSVLFAVLSIMIIASVINYEVIFRPKFKKNADYNNAFYSKSENATGLAFVIPVLTIIIAILFLGVVKYRNNYTNLFILF